MSGHLPMNEMGAPLIGSSDVYNLHKPDRPELPQDLVTEQAVLGAILMNNDVYYKVADTLCAAHFYEPLHIDMYAKMVDLFAQNIGVTPVTFAPLFKGHPIIEEIGGNQYIAKLAAETMASAYSIKGFSDTIIDYAKRRELIRIGHELADKAYDLNCEANFADIAEVQINRLSQTGNENAIFSIHDASMELLRRAEQSLKDGQQIGLDYGMPSLNSLLGQMMGGDFIVLGGATSAGKTSLAQKIAMAVAKHKHALVFSLEMDAPEFTNRYLAQKSRISTENIETAKITNDEFDRLAAVTNDFKALHMVIDGTPKLKVSQIRARAKKMAREQGLDFVLIDHLGFIEFEYRGINKIDGIGEVTRDLKALAKEMKIPIIAISHLNREANKRENKRPMLSDLYGSSSIEKDADLVFFVHREQYWLERDPPNNEASQAYAEWEALVAEAKGKAEIIVAKRRRGKGTGFRTLIFDENFTDFSELSIQRPTNWLHQTNHLYSAETIK